MYPDDLNLLFPLFSDISKIEIATSIADSSERAINTNKVIRLVYSWGIGFVLRLGKLIRFFV